MAATLSSNYKRLCPKNFSVAPKEQNVYSPDIPLSLPAPLGAECKLNPCKHIALRWSAEPFRVSDYKHRAPLEHFARISIQIKGDRIVGIGNLSQAAARTIDAQGLIVAPGSSICWMGVTTEITGEGEPRVDSRGNVCRRHDLRSGEGDRSGDVRIA